MIAIPMALLLVFSGALLLILQVSHSLVHHVALLPVDHCAFLLTLKQSICIYHISLVWYDVWYKTFYGYNIGQ